MEMISEAVAGLTVVQLGLFGSLLAGLMTGVGALPVLFMRRVSSAVQNGLLGFGAGIMLAATAFSLVLPGIEAGETHLGSTTLAAGVVALGILTGGLFLWYANHRFGHAEIGHGPYEAAVSQGARRVWLFVLAITLHNFPEGLAVGVGFGTGDVTNGMALAIGIGLQNMPEGLVVAFALLAGGYSVWPSFLVGLASGLVEPLGGLIGAGIVSLAAPLLPWGLAFAAGAMLFVINQEVVPELHREKTESRNTFGLLIGFVVMMLLDILLG